MNATAGIMDGLALVRRRLRRLGMIKAILAALTAAAGSLLGLMLADYIYDFSAPVRWVLLVGATLATAAVAGWRVRSAVVHAPTDAAVAQYIEGRHPDLQGRLMAAVEFGMGRETDSAIRAYIVGILMQEAESKLGGINLRRLITLNRIRASSAAAVIVVAVLALNGALFPKYVARQARRVLAPWIVPASSAQEELARQTQRDRFLTGDLLTAIRFRVTPGSTEVNEGGRVEVTAALSRSPADKAVVLCFRTGDGKFEELPMPGIQRVYEYARALEDVNRPIEYYVKAGDDVSERYLISVNRELKVEGFELTYNYPAYLKRAPRRVETKTGDISAVQGTRVAVHIKANGKPGSGLLKLTSGADIPMRVDTNGATAVLSLATNDTYRYVMNDARGKRLPSDSLYFIEAIPDLPPRMEVVGPNVDLMVHPISEVTMTVKVSEDQALADLSLHYEIFRDSGGTAGRDTAVKSFLPASWDGTLADAQTATILPLDEMSPYLKDGDSILYYLAAEDRKGQKDVSDLFTVRVCDYIAFLGKPHRHFNDHGTPTPALMAFISAAWNIERQRAQMARTQFEEQSKSLADKMKKPGTDTVIDFLTPAHQQPNAEMLEGYKHTLAGHQLLEQVEPGKAVGELKLVLAAQLRLAKQKGGAPKNSEANDNESRPAQPGVMTMGFVAPYHNPIGDFVAEQDGLKGDPVELGYTRKLERKDVEKIEKARHDIQKLRAEVAEIENGRRDQLPLRQQEGAAANHPPTPSASRRGQSGAAASQNQQQQQQQAQQNSGQQNAQQTASNQQNNPQQQNNQQQNNQQQSGQQQNNQQQTGQQQNGQQQAGQQQAGQQQNGQQQNGQQQTAQQQNGQQQNNQNASTPAEQSQRAAAQAEALADRLNQQLAGNDTPAVRDGLNDLRAAAARLERATREFGRGQTDAGLVETHEASRLLGNADQTLAAAEQRSLSETLAAANAQANRLADRQARAQAAIGEIQKHDAQYQDDMRAGRQSRTAQEEARREGVVGMLQDAANEAANLQRALEQAGQAARDAQARGVGEFVAQAQKIASREDIRQDMVDSAADLKSGRLASATEAQKGAARAIQQTLDALNNAADAASGTKLGAIESADRTAQRVKAEAGQLLASIDTPSGEHAQAGGQRQDNQQQAGRQQAGQQQAGQQQAGQQQAGQQQAGQQQAGQQQAGQQQAGQQQAGQQQAGQQQAGQQQAGQQQAGQQQAGQQQAGQQQAGQQQAGQQQAGQQQAGQQQAGQQQAGQQQAGQQQAGQQQAGQQQAGQQQAGQQQAGQQQQGREDRAQAGHENDRRDRRGDQDIVGHSTRERDVEQLWTDVRMLVQQLRSLDAVPAETLDAIDRQAASQEAFQTVFNRMRKADAIAFVGVVNDVADRLAKDVEKVRAEKKIRTDLREDCPPEYRRLVGMYYKILSEGQNKD